MPRTRSLAWSELKIGMLAVVAVALAAFLIIAVGGQAGFSWQRYTLKTVFPNVQGLKGGALVRVAGIEVGKVTHVGFSGAQVEVVLSVKKDVQPHITTESHASIGSVSLLGEPVVDITPATTGTPLGSGDYIRSDRPSAQIADVTASLKEGVDQATALIKDVRSGKGTMGRLLTDQDLYTDIDEFVKSADTVAGYLSKGKGTLGLLARDPKAYNQLNASLANLQEMTRRINAGEGSIGKLLKDDAIADSFKSAAGNVDRITTRLNRGEGSAGKLLTDQELYNKFNSLASRLDQLGAGLQQGQGTVGQLMQDKKLYDKMNTTVDEIRGLISDIRKDPKKYLNVKVSIF